MHCGYNNEEETLSPTKKSSLLVLYEMCYDSQWKNYSNDDKLGEIIDSKKNMSYWERGYDQKTFSSSSKIELFSQTLSKITQISAFYFHCKYCTQKENRGEF